MNGGGIFDQTVLIMIVTRNRAIFEAEPPSNLEALLLIKAQRKDIIGLKIQRDIQGGNNGRDKEVGLKCFSEVRNHYENAVLFWKWRRKKNWVFYALAVINGHLKFFYLIILSIAWILDKVMKTGPVIKSVKVPQRSMVRPWSNCD